MRKFISIIICFALLVPFVNMVSYASGVSEIEEFTVRALQFPEDEAYFVQNSNKPIIFYSNPSNPYLFRNCLTPAQKNVYDAIVKQQAGLSTNGKITFTVPRSEDLSTTIVAAISAAIDDYPELFWIGGYSATKKTGTDYYTITLTFTLDTDSYATWDVLRESYYSLLSAVENFEVKGTTRYDKLKSIHDQICNMTTYELGAPMAHQATGVFLKGKAVCEGYAEALKLLCDREGIPCLIVVGTGNGGAHEWNYVQMEDGKWYGVDATWDDQDTEIYYDYFLVGGESVNAVFGKTKFGNGTESSGDHIASGAHFGSVPFALTYPAISTQSYTGVIPIWNSVATFDNARSFMFIPRNAVAKQQILCTNTSYYPNAPTTNSATVSGTTTGGTVNITKPVSRTYTIVRRGDVDKSNTVNATDYNEVRSVAMYRKEVYKDEAQFAAADMNGDGVVDAFDAIYLDLYYRGLVD